MNILQRITTDYVEKEDRIRLTGELTNDNTLVLWFTRRLLDRVVPYLTQWLEQGSSQPVVLIDRDTLQSFAQQSAQASLDAEAPVRVAPAETGWLVESLDVTRGDNGVQLTFKGDGEPVALVLAPQHLRQWLGILFTQYQRGEWPLEVWPAWMMPVDDEDKKRIMH